MFKRYNRSSWVDCSYVKKYDGSWKDMWSEEEVLVGHGKYNIDNIRHLRQYSNNSGTYYYNFLQLYADNTGIYFQRLKADYDNTKTLYGVWAPKNPVDTFPYNKVILEFMIPKHPDKPGLSLESYLFINISITIFDRDPESDDHTNCPTPWRYYLSTTPELHADVALDPINRRSWIAPSYHSHWYTHDNSITEFNIYNHIYYTTEAHSKYAITGVSTMAGIPIKLEVSLDKIKQDGYRTVYMS